MRICLLLFLLALHQFIDKLSFVSANGPLISENVKPSIVALGESSNRKRARPTTANGAEAVGPKPKRTPTPFGRGYLNNAESRIVNGPVNVSRGQGIGGFNGQRMPISTVQIQQQNQQLPFAQQQQQQFATWNEWVKNEKRKKEMKELIQKRQKESGEILRKAYQNFQMQIQHPASVQRPHVHSVGISSKNPFSKRIMPFCEMLTHVVASENRAAFMIRSLRVPDGYQEKLIPLWNGAIELLAFEPETNSRQHTSAKAPNSKDKAWKIPKGKQVVVVNHRDNFGKLLLLVALVQMPENSPLSPYGIQLPERLKLLPEIGPHFGHYTGVANVPSWILRHPLKEVPLYTTSDGKKIIIATTEYLPLEISVNNKIQYMVFQQKAKDLNDENKIIKKRANYKMEIIPGKFGDQHVGFIALGPSDKKEDEMEGPIVVPEYAKLVLIPGRHKQIKTYFLAVLLTPNGKPLNILNDKMNVDGTNEKASTSAAGAAKHKEKDDNQQQQNKQQQQTDMMKIPSGWHAALAQIKIGSPTLLVTLVPKQQQQMMGKNDQIAQEQLKNVDGGGGYYNVVGQQQLKDQIVEKKKQQPNNQNTAADDNGDNGESSSGKKKMEKGKGKQIANLEKQRVLGGEPEDNEVLFDETFQWQDTIPSVHEMKGKGVLAADAAETSNADALLYVDYFKERNDDESANEPFGKNKNDQVDAQMTDEEELDLTLKLMPTGNLSESNMTDKNLELTLLL